MAIKDCIEEIRKLAGGELSAQDAEDIATQVQARARTKAATDKLMTEAEALTAAADELTIEMRVAAKIKARDKANNIIKDKRNVEFIDNAVKNYRVAPAKAVEAKLVGVHNKMPGAHKSVQAQQMATHKEFVGGLIHDLEKENLLEYLTRRLGLFGRDAGTVDREIANALESVDENFKVTIETTPEIKRIAEIIAMHEENSRLKANRAGGFIRKLPGYIVRQMHDQVLIRRAGMEKWIATIKPLLDPDKTFQGKDPDKFLEGAYLALSSGVHLRTVGDQTFSGPGNLAKRMSQERTLHFKKGAWFDYNEEFGSRSLIEAIFSGFEHRARDIALMETFGTNPRLAFDNLIKREAYEHRANPKWVDGLQSKKLRDMFDELDGTATQIDGLKLARFGSVTRAIQSMGKLGLAMISSFADLATAAGELRWQGQNLGSAYTGLIGHLVRGKGSKETRELAAHLGVALDGIIGNLRTAFAANDSLPGMSSDLMRLYFKANLLNWWTDSVKSGAARMMSWSVAKEAGNAWGAMNPRLQSALSSYGFDDARWNVVRQAELQTVEGKKYLTPHAVRNLADDAFTALGAKTPLQAERLRNELATDLQAFYVDRADTAVLTPGARERAIMQRGTMRGTPEGEALRFVMQFKAYPLTFATKVLGRDLEGLGIVQGLLKGKGDVLGIAHTIAATTVMGMLSMETKDILKNKTPRDPFGPQWGKVWLAAFTQGGGLGIYGDYLFGDFSRFGNTAIETAAGPALGAASDIVKIWSDLYRGEGNVPAEAVRALTNNTPFINMFYSRVILDYLVLYNLQEMMSPGYMKRIERRMKNDYDQDFLVQPMTG